MDVKDKSKDQPTAAETSDKGSQAPVVKSSVQTSDAPPAGGMQGGAVAGAGGVDQVELVVTLSGTTGELMKIEKLTDRSSGKREPLNEEEWAQVLGHDLSGAADYYDSQAAAGYDPSADLAAYYYAMDPYGYAAAYGDPYAAEEHAYDAGGGLAERLVAAGYESADAAYYQGIADYMSYTGQ